MKNNAERGIISAHDLKKPFNRLMYVLMVLLLAVMVASMLYPIAVTVLNSLKANVEVNTFPPHFFPQGKWHWENYVKGWNYIDLTKHLRSTLAIFAGNMAVTVAVIGPAAFSLSRLNWPMRKKTYYFFLSTLFIPATTYIIPNFINLKDLGLMNSYWAFWLPAGANAFYLLILKTFFDGIPHELFEAARIDGASEFRCFVQLALPLSMPIFATLSLFVFATAWNDWFWPTMILSGDKYPLSAAIKQFVIDARRLDLNIRFAILTMVMLPPIAIFLVFQRFIIRGLHLGGVKG